MKKTVRYIVALSAALVAVVSLCCCDENVTVEPGSEMPSSLTPSDTMIVYDSFTLPYNSGKSLNPFTTDSFINISLSQIIAEGLTFQEIDGTTEYVLAETVTGDTGNTVYTAKLREDILFSDGTQLTADDVVKSVEQILLNPGSYYYGRVKNIAAAAVVDEKTVMFTLALPDPQFEKMLSFPIIKGGSTEEAFIGTGAYALSADEQGNVILAANTVWHGGDTASRTINLAGTDNASELHYMLQTGKIDYYYTLDPSQTSGSFSGTDCETDVTGFLAFNTATGLMADVNMRSCVSASIDRQMLIDACDMFAVAVEQSRDEQTDISEILVQQGYDNIDEEGFRYKRVSGRNTYAQVSFAYISSDTQADAVASFISDMLTASGIKAIVTAYESHAQLLEASLNSPPDMIYTEIDLPPNSDISGLLDPVTGVSAAFAQGDRIWLGYNQYLAGNVTRAQFDAEMERVMPFASLYKRKAKMLYNRSFAEGMEISPDMAYYGAHKWYIYE